MEKVKCTCSKCGGSGYIEKYSNIVNGICFKCGGTGVIMVDKETVKHVEDIKKDIEGYKALKKKFVADYDKYSDMIKESYFKDVMLSQGISNRKDNIESFYTAFEMYKEFKEREVKEVKEVVSKSEFDMSLVFKLLEQLIRDIYNKYGCNIPADIFNKMY